MANSKQLRENKNQHKPKNKQSKVADRDIYLAMMDVKEYLEVRFAKWLKERDLVIDYEKNLSFGAMINLIKTKKIRNDFDKNFCDRTIKPDGGILSLRKLSDEKYYKIVIIAETKYQGTNDLRLQAGLKKQAQGNAIERLGKNLTGIRAMFNHEKITPFVCFGSGYDFKEKEGFVMSKISMLNEFYYLNRIYVSKADGTSDLNYFSPVSMYFRYEN
ncbi:2351_t:CDS:1 [Cetraspora pellucida]|uniref:2351_t:CDS:1 n=1 Tax=Cetraspora pellucida TaxID=1433469 RepID=A0ACA9KYV4_9GLOM|nr:2351_t:CDS:1 [Cetraspora pellucida]